MISFTLWEFIFVVAALYWPIMAMASILVVLTAFMATRHIVWSLFWSVLAAGLLIPAIWLYLIA